MADYEIQNPKARAVVEQMFAGHGQRRLAQLQRLDPELRAVVEDVIYGGLYARDILDQRTRELCAVAALTIIGRPPSSAHTCWPRTAPAPPAPRSRRSSPRWPFTAASPPRSAAST